MTQDRQYKAKFTVQKHTNVNDKLKDSTPPSYVSSGVLKVGDECRIWRDSDNIIETNISSIKRKDGTNISTARGGDVVTIDTAHKLRELDTVLVYADKQNKIIFHPMKTTNHFPGRKRIDTEEMK